MGAGGEVAVSNWLISMLSADVTHTRIIRIYLTRATYKVSSRKTGLVLRMVLSALETALLKCCGRNNDRMDFELTVVSSEYMVKRARVLSLENIFSMILADQEIVPTVVDDGLA